VVSLGQPLLPTPTADPCLVTNKAWVGALRPTNNTGEFSAFYCAIQFIRSSGPPLDEVSTSWLTARFLFVYLPSNKDLIQRIRRGLALVKHSENLSIGWTKAHSTATTPEALGNTAADRLAARGRSGLSHQMTQPPPPRAHVPLSSPSQSSLVRVPCRLRRSRSCLDSRTSPVYSPYVGSALVVFLSFSSSRFLSHSAGLVASVSSACFGGRGGHCRWLVGRSSECAPGSLHSVTRLSSWFLQRTSIRQWCGGGSSLSFWSVFWFSPSTVY